MSRRKAREGEVVCRCGAYSFPHRQLGGRCTGKAFIADYFEMQMYGECRQCNSRDTDDPCEVRCQVLDGRDKPTLCPGLEEHIHYNGIKLYGVNKP